VTLTYSFLWFHFLQIHQSSNTKQIRCTKVSWPEVTETTDQYTLAECDLEQELHHRLCPYMLRRRAVYRSSPTFRRNLTLPSSWSEDWAICSSELLVTNYMASQSTRPQSATQSCESHTRRMLSLQSAGLCLAFGLISKSDTC
jgi:hypothetical protein